MKSFAILLLLCLLGVATANIPKPQLTIGVSNGKFDKIGALEPTIKWATSGKVGEFDVEGGLDVLIEDVKSWPFSAWAKAKKTLFGFDVSARGRVDSRDLENVDLDIQVNGPTTSLQFLGKGGPTIALNKVQITKTVRVLGGNWVVNPSYNLRSSFADVSCAYTIDKTSFKVDAAAKKLTIAQSVGKKTKIIPSITAAGKFAVDVQRSFDQYGKLTTSLKPKESVNVKWEDGPWVANLYAPMSSYYKFDKVDVSLKRKVDF